MPQYQINVPGKGTFRVNSPTDLTDVQVWEAVQGQLASAPAPAPAPSTERTVGEAFKDIGASVVGGFGSLLQVPGQLAQLVPGLQGVGQAIAKPGEALEDVGERLKSEGLKVREALRSKAISEAEKDGILSSFATAITETVKDPALLSTFITGQLPQLLGPAAAAKVGKAVVLSRSGLEGAELAAQAGKIGTRSAVGAGAAMQGADISADAYKQALEAAQKQGMSEEDANAAALLAARKAFALATPISVLSQALPGGSAIERRLAGVAGKGRLKSAIGEAVSEAAEEGGGAFATNVGVLGVDPTRELTQGVGAAAGLGTIGGGILGGVLGKAPAPELPPELRPGETDRQAAERIQAEILAMKEAAKPPAPGPILDTNNLYTLMAQPNGYALVEQYKQRLAELPETEETKAAIEEASFIQRRSIIEGLERQPTKAVLTDKTLKQMGFKPKDGVYESLLGMDMASPDQADEITQTLSAVKAQEDITPAFVGKIDNAINVVNDLQQRIYPKAPPGAQADVGEAVTPPSGEGVPLAVQPSAGAAPTGLGVTEPSGVVPPVADVEQPAGGEAAKPAPIEKVWKTKPDFVLSDYPIDAEILNLRKMNEIAQRQKISIDVNQMASDALKSSGRIGEVFEPAGSTIETAPVVSTPSSTRDAVAQHAVKGLPIIEAPIEQLSISKDVPQFKSEADVSGIVKPLEGKFERTGVAPIQLWRREDGRLEVISGRHRFDLAKRSGETTIPAQIHDEAAGFDAAKAATLDAELNIRDEQGEVKDYVTYFERSGISEADTKARGLLGRPVGQRGWTIASKGSPDLIAAHRAGIVPDDAAAGIAAVAPGDARLQSVGIKAVRDNKSAQAAVNTVQAVKALAAEKGAPEEEAGDLFGFDDSAIKEAEEMARIATDKQREVSKRLDAISGAAKRPDVAKAEGIDIKDETALNKRIQELRQLRASWSNWSSSPDLIKEIRDEMTKPVTSAPAVPAQTVKQPEVEAPTAKLSLRLNEAIQAAKSDIEAQIKDWSSRVYKANKKQVELAGDGPSRQASMSVSQINESKRRRAVEGLQAELKAVRDLEKQIADPEMAERLLNKSKRLFKEAQERVASGEAQRKDAGLEFEATLLSELGIRPPRGAYESNNISKSIRRVVEALPAEPEVTEQEAKPYEPLTAQQEEDVLGLFAVARGEPKKSLVEMRKRYEAGRAAPAPVETKPEPTELDKEIEAKIEELGRVLSRIMGRFGLKDVALNLVEDMKAEGEYAQSVIRLALDAASPVQALRHESIHALKELGFFTPQQWAALEKQAKSKWIDQYLKNVNINKEPLGEGEKSRYDAYMDLYKGDMDAIIEEAIADAFGDFDVNKAPSGLMQAILTRLRNFFDAVKTAFGGEITAEQVFRKVEKGELGKVTTAGSQSITRESLRVMRGEEVPNLGKKVTVDMVGKYFDDQFVKEFGGKLDYNNPEHFDRAVKQATEEVQYQIKNDKSGLDWYEEDIQKAFKDTAKILPELKKKDNRILFSVIAGIMSPQTIARDNWFIAAKAFEHYVKTGDIPGINPENGNLWMGGTQSANKKVQLEFLDRMVKDLGQTNAIKWMMTPHSVSEINEFRSKYGNIKSGIDGKATDIKPGLYAFGPKIGPFVSNINGIHDVTVDKWFTRTFNRYFGTMIGPDGKIIDAPTEPQRRFIKELANKVAEDAGIKNYQVQSLLWFYEQRLFTELGAQSPSYGFSDGAVKFLESRGKGGGAGVAVPAGPTGAGKVKPAPKKQPKYSLRDSIGLYSELENKVAQGPNKAPAASWKAYINGLTQKGVKPEEIEWSGVRDWLDLQTGPVSKDAVNAYLKQGGVKVEETMLGGRFALPKKLQDYVDYYGGETNSTSGLLAIAEEAEQDAQRFQRRGNTEKANELFEIAELANQQAERGETGAQAASYGQYTLPGGENYREVLLTLPMSKVPSYDEITEFAKRWVQEEFDRRGTRFTDDQEKVDAMKDDIWAWNDLWSEAAIKHFGLKDTGRLRPYGYGSSRTTDAKPADMYESKHWDRPNVIAHIRLNDRTDADGNKVLFVEEIQSDWGQEGKKKGFASGDWEAPYREWERGLRERAKTFYFDPTDTAEEQATALRMGEKLASREDLGSIATVMGERQQMSEAWNKAVALRGRIPSAPFVTKTEGWLNLALKRIMVMAAEGGYDKVAFVSGEQSADRYDLSKQVDSIEYIRDDSRGTIGYVVRGATQARDRIIQQGEETPSKLEDIIGKELVKKMIDGPEEGTLSGLDLKVGGEGMKAFYNQIVPLAVKKLLPKVGGSKMEDVSLLKDSFKKYDKELMKDDLKALGEEGFRAKYAHDKQPGFSVTPEMKQKVETTGLPRFSLRSTIPTATRQRIVQTTIARDEKTFYQRIIEAISPNNFQSFRADALNRYDQLSVYDKKLAQKMGGKALLASSSAESAALFSDLGAGLTASALGVHDRMGGVPVYRNGVTIISNQNGTVKGPTAIFAPLAKYNDPFAYQAYQFWAGVKRGSRFLADGREQLFEPADIQKAEDLRKQFLKDGVDFDAIQKEWIKYNDGLVNYMVDTGVLSKERADIYKKHSDYLPFYRQMDGVETVGPKIFQSISGIKPPKKLKGGEAPIDDFLENIVRNTQSAIQAGIKNIAAQRAAEVATKIDMAERLKYHSTAPNVFHVYENGKPVSYETQDQLFINAIKSLGLPDLPFIGLFSGPANLLRNLVTKDPGFMLANLMRDSMSAWVTSGVKMTPMVDTITNFGAAIAGKSPEFQALMNSGILGGYEFSQNVEQSGREFGKALRKQANVKQPGMKGVLEMGAKPFTSLWEALEKGSTASDAATRMEVYKKTLAETGNEAEALHRALEVMNFNRKGSSAVIRVLTAAVPFLNARMQGLDVLYRAGIGPALKSLKGEPLTDQQKAVMKSFFVRGATLAALSTFYWAMTHDDDEYKKQEQETRDNYWLLPSLGVKIPIPFEIGVLFKVIPERILGYAFGSDTGEDFLKSMARQLTSTLAFNPIPQTVLPVVESMTNFSFFTMRPIVGQGLEGLQPAYQVGPGTSRIAEKIGAATKSLPTELQISPAKLDQMISGYTGTMGMYMVNLMDAVFDMNTDSPKPSRRFEQMPLIRRFAIDPEARGSVTAYYELKNSVDSIVRTSNMLERTMNYEELPAYLQDNAKMLATKDYLLDLEKTMKEFREMKILIRSAKMSAEAKGDAIASIEKMENQLTANIQYLKSLAKGG